MSDTASFAQIRVALILAGEIRNGELGGVSEAERMDQLCNRYDAEPNPAILDLAGQFVTFNSNTLK